MKWLERQRNFIDFTLSSLSRRKGKNASLILVYTLLIFIISSVIFFTHAIRREAGALLKNAPDMVLQRTVAGRHDLIPLSYGKKIQAIRGVKSVQGRLWGYYYHPAAHANYTVMAADGFDPGDNAAHIGSGVARTWQTAGDNTLYFKAYDGTLLGLRIANVFSDASDLIAADLIVVSRETFKKLFGISESLATDLAVEIGNRQEAAIIALKMVQLFPDTRPILKDEILRTYAAIFDWRSGYIIVLLSGTVLAFIIFAWDKATGLSAEEKIEIGILKAVGWDTSDVLLMKFWEGTVVSLTSFLLGVAAGYVHVFFASAPLFAHALKGWSVLYPVFKLTPTVNVFQIGTLFFFTVVPYALITIIPAWRMAVTEPDAVMRQI
jgi:ABC-type lipoprotein release transport system permease subunit